MREKSIVFTVSDEDLHINGRPLGFFRSTVAMNTVITHVDCALVTEKFDAYPGREGAFRAGEKHLGTRLRRHPRQEFL